MTSLFLNMLVILLLIVIVYSEADYLCYNHHPTKDTNKIISQIAEKYGFMVKEKSRGHAIHSMVIGANKKIEIEGVEFKLNDDASDKDHYEVEPFQVLPYPVYVAPTEEIMTSFQKTLLSHKERASYTLSRISRECENGFSLCGLMCCPNVHSQVQKEFIEIIDANKRRIRSAAANRVANVISINEDQTIYELSHKPSKDQCNYRLSALDPVVKHALYENQEKYEFIVFTCEEGDECCGLGCRPTEYKKMKSGQALKREREPSYGDVVKHLLGSPYTILVLCSVVFLIIFTFLLRVQHRRAIRHRVQKVKLQRHESQTEEHIRVYPDGKKPKWDISKHTAFYPQPEEVKRKMEAEESLLNPEKTYSRPTSLAIEASSIAPANYLDGSPILYMDDSTKISISSEAVAPEA